MPVRQTLSPVGTPTAVARRGRAERSAAYRKEQQRVADFERIARLVIKYRAELKLTQKELADRVGTSHSAISRIEGGQHKTNIETLARIAHALDRRLVIGFERGSVEHPTREVVAV